jgi:hypothetical protein
LVVSLRVAAAYDQLLLDFLAEEGYAHGYAGYWTSYRLTFRSGEAVIFDTSLPHEDKGHPANSNRYPPYVARVAAAERVVWITQNFPPLDALLDREFAARGITYQMRGFGPYRVYYDFSARIAPSELGVDWARPVSELLGE